MIVTITMNAAIDKMNAVERNEPGEVLRVRECVATPGGQGIERRKGNSGDGRAQSGHWAAGRPLGALGTGGADQSWHSA